MFKNNSTFSFNTQRFLVVTENTKMFIKKIINNLVELFRTHFTIMLNFCISIEYYGKKTSEVYSFNLELK